jgi:Flp pilus assembly pilin Flp
MIELFERLWQEEEGQDLTEYALLLVLVSLTATAGMHTFADSISRLFRHASYAVMKHHVSYE